MTTKNFTKTKLRRKKLLKDKILSKSEKQVKLEFKPEIIAEDTVEFVRKVPSPARERLRWKFRKEIAVKKIPINPCERLKHNSKKVKRELKLELNESEHQKLNLLKRQFLIQNIRWKGKQNISRWKFNCFTKQFSLDLKEFLEKPLTFNIEKTSEDQIIDKIIGGLPKDNDQHNVDQK